jgi:hypothetical protein
MFTEYEVVFDRSQGMSSEHSGKEKTDSCVAARVKGAVEVRTQSRVEPRLSRDIFADICTDTYGASRTRK